MEVVISATYRVRALPDKIKRCIGIVGLNSLKKRDKKSYRELMNFNYEDYKNEQNKHR